MRKFLTLLICTFLVISLASCGGNTEELETRITSLETEVAILTEQVNSFADYRLSPSYYGAVYHLTDQSWADFAAFCESLSPEEFESWSYSNSNYAYNEGQNYFMRTYDLQISFGDENKVTLRGPSGINLTTTYEKVGNDIVIPLRDFAVIMDSNPEAFDDVSFTFGIISEDESCITLGSQLADEGQPINLYKD